MIFVFLLDTSLSMNSAPFKTTTNGAKIPISTLDIAKAGIQHFIRVFTKKYADRAAKMDKWMLVTYEEGQAGIKVSRKRLRRGIIDYRDR